MEAVQLRPSQKRSLAKWYDWVLLYSIVLLHLVVIFFVISSLLVLPFSAPWYISFPLMSYIFLSMTSSVLDCPMTKLENRIRERIGLPKIRGFVGHYLVKPIRKLFK